MNPHDDLEQIRQDVDADLAMVEASRRAATRESEAMLFDPTAVDAYEVRLRSLHESVLAVEDGEENLGPT